jgi:uncharacterized protein (TIGR02246 family)
MKKIFFATIISLFSIALSAQSKDADEVKAVLQKYHTAIEKLDPDGTVKLFTADSQIFESGGSEGTYLHYLEHHLGPEFKDFSSFKFSDYKVDVQVNGNYAFATETYRYTITLVKDKQEIKRKGVATSVLKKTNGEWKIMTNHSSSRKG